MTSRPDLLNLPPGFRKKLTKSQPKATDEYKQAMIRWAVEAADPQKGTAGSSSQGDSESGSETPISSPSTPVM